VLLPAERDPQTRDPHAADRVAAVRALDDAVQRLAGGLLRIQPDDVGRGHHDAVYTHDDDMAEGVVSAIQNAGREDEMFLTGAGGSKAAMEQIKKGGLYRATFLYNPSMSASAIRMARKIVRGEGFEDLTEPEVPQKITVPATTVTKDNVDQVQELGF
jgi:ABC-type sugar transport system substrate-binding protein